MTLTQVINAGIGSSNTVTSEGGNVTTSLQQGLIKAYHRYTQHSSFATLDSLNLSSSSDDNAGISTHNWTNNFGNDDYIMAGSCGSGNFLTKYGTDEQVATTNVTTSDFHIRTSEGSNTPDDDDQQAALWTGDLA